MAKKSIKEEIREILAEDFVGPPLPEQGMASPFAADYVNAPPGYESAPTEILYPWLQRSNMLTNRQGPWPDDYPGRFRARETAREEAHPATGYYGEIAYPGNTPAMGSRGFFPDWMDKVPERGEFYPPPTISNEDQEMLDARAKQIEDSIYTTKAPTGRSAYGDTEFWSKANRDRPQPMGELPWRLGDIREESHPAYGYMENNVHSSRGPYNPVTGFPPIPYQSSDEFHPPPTISNEEQEIIDSGKDDLSRAIMRALQESKKGDK